MMKIEGFQIQYFISKTGCVVLLEGDAAFLGTSITSIILFNHTDVVFYSRNTYKGSNVLYKTVE